MPNWRLCIGSSCIVFAQAGTGHRRGRAPVAAVAAYEAPFHHEDTPRSAVDPAEHIGDLVGAGRQGEAVRLWMAEVVRMPTDMVAQMERARGPRP